MLKNKNIKESMKSKHCFKHQSKDERVFKDDMFNEMSREKDPFETINEYGQRMQGLDDLIEYNMDN